MHEILLPVFAVALLLVAVSVTVPLSDRLRIPHSVLLAGLGVALGLAAAAMRGRAGTSVVEDLLRGLAELGVGANAFLAIFLPPLLFVAGLTIDVRRLIDEFAAVLLLAVVAVVVCTAVAGWALAAVTGAGLVPSLLLGAIIATTDPAAVVAIFRDIGAPRRLTILVEGESLYNDAAAIALFGILLAILTGRAAPDAAEVIGGFLLGFAGGIAAGFVIARAFCEILPRMGGSLAAEATLTIALAYLAFIVSELYLGVSGVVAVATASLTTAAYGPVRLAPRNWRSLVETWGKIEFWASSLIFVLAAMLAARILSDVAIGDVWPVLVLAAAALVARALVLFILLPGLSAARLVQPVDHRYKAVILWGGLRGAVTMVLAIAVSENHAIAEGVRHSVAIIAIGFVLFTLFVNAPTLAPLLRLLGLDRLDPLELALRDRVMALSRAGLRAQVAQVAQDYGLDAALVDEVAAAPAGEPGADDAIERGLPEPVRLKVGLLTLVNRERECYLRHFDEGGISRRLAARLVAGADRLIDRVKTDGLAGYERGARDAVRFPLPLRFALWLHRRFGWSALLSRELADRFELLLIQRLVLREARQFNDRSVRPVLGASATKMLATLLATRMEGVQRALAALELQYPAYAAALGAQHLARAALRFEDAEYRLKREEALISREVFDNLQHSLRARREAALRRPPLDLGLKLAEMVRRVPIFAGLGEAELAQVARLLKPMIAVPGEPVVRKGERGTAMFFIAAGAVEVQLAAGPVRLVVGDFFGELALLHQQPRSADVTATGWCHLLALDAGDFRRLLRASPRLRAEIEATARRRRESNLGAAAAG